MLAHGLKENFTGTAVLKEQNNNDEALPCV